MDPTLEAYLDRQFGRVSQEFTEIHQEFTRSIKDSTALVRNSFSNKRKRELIYFTTRMTPHMVTQCPGTVQTNG
jgi:hypothetical protein